MPCRGAALLGVLACAAACSVDQSGLETSAKLGHDAGLLPGTGAGGTGTGGTLAGGTGGSIAATGGSGGERPGTGGATGGTGVATGGTAGSSSSTGGAVGAGGTAGADATGGGAGQGAGGAGGGGEGGSGGVAGSGGVQGSGGAGGLGGSGGAGGQGGSAGHCTAMNCTGCCANNVCVKSVSAQQCGARGAACMACGPCQTCSMAGACAIDPGSQWTIAAAGAQVAMSPPIGGTWDPYRGDEGGPAPDLFCEFENPSGDVTPTTAGVTTTIVDAYTASWNQTITPAGVTISASALMAAKPAWRIWVGDEDCSRTNVCNSGQIVCAYQQPFTAAQLTSGSASITNLQSCTSLDLTLICASGP